MAEITLLPNNRSDLEQYVALSLAEATALPVTLRQLWDPQCCPLHLLPWLAWALSVDDWDDRWPEHVKRLTVQRSYEVHRYKGTPYAVKTALDNLNIRTQLREWWENEGSGIPGTVTLLALINENIIDGDGLLTAEMLEQITRIVRCTKRGSIHFDIELGIHLIEGLAFAGGLALVGYADHDADLLPIVPEEIAAATGLGSLLRHCAFTCQQGEISALLPAAAELDLPISLAGSYLLILDFDMGIQL